MFTYAVAWGLLLPFYPEHFRKTSNEEDTRNEVGKLYAMSRLVPGRIADRICRECALFSNISAMAVMLAKEDDITPEKKGSLGQIGLASSEICISAKEFVTVGIMAKSCESHIFCPRLLLPSASSWGLISQADERKKSHSPSLPRPPDPSHPTRFDFSKNKRKSSRMSKMIKNSSQQSPRPIRLFRQSSELSCFRVANDERQNLDRRIGSGGSWQILDQTAVGQMDAMGDVAYYEFHAMGWAWVELSIGDILEHDCTYILE